MIVIEAPIVLTGSTIFLKVVDCVEGEDDDGQENAAH